MILLLILQALVPVLFLTCLVFGRPASRLDLAFRVGATAGYLLAVANAGLWLALPRFVLWVLVATFPLAAATALRRSSGIPAQAPSGWVLLRLLGAGVLCVTALGVAGMSFPWRGAPSGPAVDLSFPLGAGTYYVANGGGHRGVNAHMGIPEHALGRYRGQIHGVDLVRIFLAHLKGGSVLVKAGGTVTQGDPIGLVGNSGNSDEPHLHIHAQRPGSPLNPMGAEPISLRFGGRTLARNQRIRQ